jgi:tetratricopeptide (TPR) repeat protein
MKLDLCMIVKDEVEKLKGIFEQYRGIFDDAHIVITHSSRREELEKLCEEFNCKHYWFDWIDDFSAARNFAASKVTGDYYFRMDCDDTLSHHEIIREVAKKAYDESVNIVYVLYEYARDEWGNLNASHYRETIIRRSDELKWNKSIHETVVSQNPTQHKIKLEEGFTVVHHKTPEEAKEAQVRNFQFLIKEYNRDKEKTDPRTIAYLGRTFFTCGDHEKAIFFLQKHINASGWDEDRYMSWCMLSDIFRMRGDHQKATASAFEAIQERPDYPDAYFRLHDSYLDQNDWLKAIHWAELGMRQPTPKSFMLFDPSSYTWRPALSLAHCYFQISEFDKAGLQV